MPRKYPAFPTILASQWPRLKEEGWRYHRTCQSDEIELNQALCDALRHQHGDTNVAIGHCWDESALAPLPRPDRFSIYVRDVEDQIRTFKRSLEEL